MKKFLTILASFTFFASAQTFYVIDDKVEVFDPIANKKIGIISRGTFGEKIKEDDERIILKVQGFLKNKDTKTLYATKNTMLPLIVFDDDNNKNSLEIAIAKNKVSEDQINAWADAEILYYDTCSMCHAAHAPKEHTMLEWEGIFTTMRAFAMPTDSEADIIIQYLRAHAIDGYATDDDE
ncbi:hypothetical protein [Helicobacter anatolicus]|uniref:hypothetical protein n=1 Tax=Helicobacter anatolicus TaxID=2905874 RepID=UPI001E5CF52C|nr:hypothetical protein [Helicobacter anatolicus]MCE3039271.1 hypothetical protein [Helicobacter anatolicus]